MIDKSPKKISAMFDEIAPTYDKLNHAFTLNLDKLWRRKIVQEILKRKYEKNRILDLATGTGDLALELVNLYPEVLVAADFSKEMLDYQRRKKSNPLIELVEADASNLPFNDVYFDIVTIGFGVRNFFDLKKCLKEISRVIKPGGRLIVLEIFKSNGVINKIFNFYFGKVVPAFGNRVSGSSHAYSYLFNSVENFHTLDEFGGICKEFSFEQEFKENNFLGIVNTIYFCKKK